MMPANPAMERTGFAGRSSPQPLGSRAGNRGEGGSI